MRHRLMAVVASTAVTWATAGVGTLTAADDPWAHVVELTAPNPADEDSLGRSVALDGNVIVAGANGGESHPGEVHVVTRDSSTGVWSTIRN
jgi:hypothetical protein